MKKITNYFKALVVFCMLIGARQGMAQVCNTTMSLIPGPNGTATFYAFAQGSNTVSPNTYIWMVNNSVVGSGINLSQLSYTFTTNGTYTVYVGYQNGAGTCTSVATQTIVITNAGSNPNPCTLNANLSYSQGANGLVNFNNTSTGTAGGTTYSWNFGDSSPAGSGSSPVHTYAANGQYVVTLTANNNFTYTCTDTQTYTITVNSYCNPIVANFTYVQNNNVLNFTNTSTGTNGSSMYAWSFGDATGSSIQNPTHTYLANGSYTVSLIVSSFSTSPGCGDTTSQVITVSNIAPCVANANFSVVPTGTAQVWNAIPTAPSNVVAAQWSWGDSSFSNTLYTSHNYAAAGTYDICLTVTVSCGASATYCAPYAIFRSSQDNSVISINVVDPSASVGIKAVQAENDLYTISPNPSNGSFKLNMKTAATSNVNVSVYNLVGKLVYQADNVSSNGLVDKEINLNEVANGVYFVKINLDSKELTKKIVINKQ